MFVAVPHDGRPRRRRFERRRAAGRVGRLVTGPGGGGGGSGAALAHGEAFRLGSRRPPVPPLAGRGARAAGGFGAGRRQYGGNGHARRRREGRLGLFGRRHRRRRRRRRHRRRHPQRAAHVRRRGRARAGEGVAGRFGRRRFGLRLRLGGSAAPALRRRLARRGLAGGARRWEGLRADLAAAAGIRHLERQRALEADGRRREGCLRTERAMREGLRVQRASHFFKRESALVQRAACRSGLA